MKKSIVSLLLVACMLPCYISLTFANEGYALCSRNFTPDVIWGKLKLMPSSDIVLLDKDPSIGNVEYVSWVSYDYLSELSLKWDSYGVVVYNSYMDAYFIRVSYVPTVSQNGGYAYCALGTTNGFVLGSKSPTSTTNIDNSTTIHQQTVVNKTYISTIVGSADKTVASINKGLENILKWLDVLSDGIELMIRHQDLTNTILHWMAVNVYDLMHTIAEIDLIVAEAGVEQLKSLNRIDSAIRGISSNQMSLISVLNEHLSSVTSQLGSVIRNGQIQVNTSPLEARLDKLISMYSKVNSVVLDTASVNGGQITGAVGGELKDVVFWGMSNQTSLHLYSSPDINYTLNGAAAHIPFTDPSGNIIVLRSVPLGSSIPSYISNDPVLLAGVWRSGSTYIISDTLDTSTGVYTQRIKELTLTGSESGYGVRARANGSVLFYRLYTGDGQLAARSSHFTFVNFDSTLSSNGATSQSIRDCTFSYANSMFYLASTSFTTTAQWTAWLKSHYNAGHPFTLYYVNGPASTWTAAPVSTDSCITIAIPEGNSTISADLLRITGKYETYDSYTQTADIINAINNIPPVDLDLTPLSTRLDTLNTAIATVNSNVKNIKSYTSSMKTSLTAVNTALTSVIADGLLKVDNSAVVTALGKLDKLDELPTIKTAVDGVNTTIASVIADGQLKVDNSAVVAAIEGIQAGSAADLSPVVVRMDAILAELQSAPGSAACEHTYTQHTEQEATCTLPGLLIFTCSQCGDSYSEIVDPLGHDWIVTSHVDAVTDPETGEETASAYDVYTCSRCQRTYEDHDGSGPEEDYSSSSISKLVVKVFSRLGTFAGKLIGSVIHLFDKAITALDNVVSKFNEYVEQISGFGGGYPAWLTGFWGVLPAELQVALTFAVICMALGVVGKKLFFS